MKAIAHIHTRYSYDSISSVSKIVRLALSANVKLLLITDHDTLSGSIAARKFVSLNKLDIIVPLAAEYLTNYGDLIVVNIPENFVPDYDFNITAKNAKKLGATTILPHPYDNHQLDKIDFEYVDYIECFNSRSSIEKNAMSNDLCDRLKKKKIFGSDAHFVGNVLDVIFEIENVDFSSSYTPIKTDYASKKSKIISQIIKAIKKRDIKLLAHNIKNLLLYEN